MVTITLDRTEFQFLLHRAPVYREILNPLIALQVSVPNAEPPPLTLDAIFNIAALADRIELQGDGR